MAYDHRTDATGCAGVGPWWGPRARSSAPPTLPTRPLRLGMQVGRVAAARSPSAPTASHIVDVCGSSHDGDLLLRTLRFPACVRQPPQQAATSSQKLHVKAEYDVADAGPPACVRASWAPLVTKDSTRLDIHFHSIPLEPSFGICLTLFCHNNLHLYGCQEGKNRREEMCKEKLKGTHVFL